MLVLENCVQKLHLLAMNWIRNVLPITLKELKWYLNHMRNIIGRLRMHVDQMLWGFCNAGAVGRARKVVLQYFDHIRAKAVFVL